MSFKKRNINSCVIFSLREASRYLKSYRHFDGTKMEHQRRSLSKENRIERKHKPAQFSSFSLRIPDKKTCFQRDFRVSSFSKKISFIKKRVEQSKNKECKKRYLQKWFQLRKFFKSVLVQYTIALFWGLALILALHCYCGDNVKNGLLSKHLLQRKRQYGG